MNRRSFLMLSGGALAALAAEGLWPRLAGARVPASGALVSRSLHFHDRTGRAYRIEPARHAVVGLDGAGAERWRFGGDPQAGLNFPVAMAEDARGRLYVLDKGNARIHVLDSDGHHLAEFAAGSRGPDAPSDLAIDARGRLYLCQPVRNRVLVLDLTGRELGTLGSGDPAGWHTPRSLALDGAGNLHVLEFGRSRVVVVRPDGAFVRSYGGRGDAPGHFMSPRAIRRDEAGHMVVADASTCRLHRFTPGGKHVSTWQPVLPDGRAATPLHLGRASGDRLMIAASPIV
jgi:sugar lactone lactonase YvrE